MTDPRLFPLLIIALFALAAIRYAFDRNWPQVAYWGSAAVLNIAVLNMEAK